MGFDEEQKLVSVIIPKRPGVRLPLDFIERIGVFTRMEHEFLVVEHERTAQAINEGCAKAQGNYLCWLDPAIRVGERWLEGLIEIYRIYARCGITVPRRVNGAEIVARGEHFRRYPDILINQSLDLSCALIPLWIYRTVGPLDGRYELRHVADCDYFERLRRNDFFVGVSGRCTVDWEPFEGLGQAELESYDHDTDLMIHRDRRKGLDKAGRIARRQADGLDYNGAQWADLEDGALS